MTDYIIIEPWWRFGVALLIGALLGLEREFIQQRTGDPDFAGIRTFSLISLLGAVVAYLTIDVGMTLAFVAFAGLLLILAVSYYAAVMRLNKELGITTEIAVLLTFLFGAMVVWDRAEVAIALAVITALLLSLKGSLHAAVRQMNANDLRLTLEFGLVAAVVLPLLPNRTIDPWGVLNPFEVWLLVVLVSGIGFAGYILMKVLGAGRGINLTGLLGGLVSSTATTVSFASRSREAPGLTLNLAQGIVLASCVLSPRLLILVAAIFPALALPLLLPLGSMLAVGVGGVLFLQRYPPTEAEEDDHEVPLNNPLKLTTAIAFGLLFAAILVILELTQQFFGTTGVYIASALAGLTDVDAISLSASRLTSNGQLSLQVGATAVMIAVLVNTISKGAIAYALGAPALRRPVISIFAAMLLVGTLGIIALWVVG